MKEYPFIEGCNQGVGLPVGSLALGWWLQEGKLPGESRPQRMGRSEAGAEEGEFCGHGQQSIGGRQEGPRHSPGSPYGST